MLPDDFDFTAVDRPSFKEDSVREEMIAPILRKLGYRPTGELRVERSKSLLHPFVMIGTRKHKIHIIPDYTLYSGETPLLVLDAKSPSEDVASEAAVGQAYSYAIHPEVRSRHFGLCNGRELVVYEVASLEPVLKIAMREVNARWNEIASALAPRVLLRPFLREFKPDLGFHLKIMGEDISDTLIHGVRIQLLAKISDVLWSAQCPCGLWGLDFMASLDMAPSFVSQILEALPAPVREKADDRLSRNPFSLAMNGKVSMDFAAELGEVTVTEHEGIVPLMVTHIANAKYDPAFEGGVADWPAHIPQL